MLIHICSNYQTCTVTLMSFFPYWILQGVVGVQQDMDILSTCPKELRFSLMKIVLTFLKMLNKYGHFNEINRSTFPITWCWKKSFSKQRLIYYQRQMDSVERMCMVSTHILVCVSQYAFVPFSDCECTLMIVFIIYRWIIWSLSLML